MTRKKSHKDFVNEVIDLHGDVYNFLSKYIKNNEQVNIQHKLCGYKWGVQPVILLDKRKAGKIYCPQCNGRVLMTTELAREKIDKLNKNYELIGEYSSGEKATIKHTICQKTFLTEIFSFFKSPKCYHCDGHKIIIHEEFVEKVFKIVSNEYEVLSTYINSSKKILIRHNNASCGNNEYYVRPTDFLNKGSRCPKCSLKVAGEQRRNSHKKFEEELFKATRENAYSILSEYNGNREKITVKHSQCGYEWSVRAGDLLRLSRKGKEPCPKCSKKILISDEDFKREIFKLVGNEYVFIEEFSGYSTPIKVKHNIPSCSHIYSIKPTVFINQDVRCQKCYFSNRRKTQEEFESEVFNLVNNEYKVTGQYKNATSKIEFLHNTETCKNIFSMNPSEFLSGQRCPLCSRKNAIEKITKTHSTFVKEVIGLHGDVFDFLSSYQSSLGSVHIRHKECGYEWNAPVANILRERIQGIPLCPNCSGALSQGESLITKILSEHKIEFIHQYAFSDCVYKLPLRFDFGIIDSSNTLNYLIEYDGKQHFHAVEWFGGEEALVQQIEKDQIKNQYCIDNDIPLYRIPYWELRNIEEILLGIIKYENRKNE